MAVVKILNTVGATVKINGVEQESVVVAKNSTVTWSVTKEGYVGQNGSLEVTEDTVLPVVLKREEYGITFDITPADATLTVNGEVMEKGEDGNYHITAKYGDELSWSVSKEGYVTQSGTHTVDGDDEIDVVLEAEQFTFKIEPTPGDATVTINGELTDSVTVDYGSTVEWEVSREGYVTRSGSEVVTEDTTKKVTLEETPYLTVTPESLDFSSEGGSAVVRVSCSEDWTAEIEETVLKGGLSSSLSISKDSGTAGETDIEVTAEEYSITTYGRSWTLLITSASGLTVAVAVSQSAASGDDSGDSGGQVGGGLITPQYTLTVRCVLNSGFSAETQDGGGGLVTVPTLRLTVDGSSGTRVMSAVSDTEYTYSEAFDEGTVVTYELSASGFTSKSGTVTMDQDRSVRVTLSSD